MDPAGVPEERGPVGALAPIAAGGGFLDDRVQTFQAVHAASAEPRRKVVTHSSGGGGEVACLGVGYVIDAELDRTGPF